jgi:hypothetical protein
MKLGKPLCDKVFDCFYEITYIAVRKSVKGCITSGLMWSTQYVIYTPIHTQTYNLIYWNVGDNIIKKYDGKNDNR